MRRSGIGVFCIACALAINAGAAETPPADPLRIPGFRLSRAEPSFSVRDYDFFMIRSIDLTGIEVILDGEEEDASECVRKQIAEELHTQFYRMLTGIVPLATERATGKAVRILYADIALAGTFEDRGFLMAVLSAVGKENCCLSIGAEFFDSRDNRRVLWFSDKRHVNGHGITHTWTMSARIDAWGRIMEAWADTLAAFFARNKGIRYVPCVETCE